MELRGYMFPSEKRNAESYNERSLARLPTEIRLSVYRHLFDVDVVRPGTGRV